MGKQVSWRSVFAPVSAQSKQVCQDTSVWTSSSLLKTQVFDELTAYAGWERGGLWYGAKGQMTESAALCLYSYVWRPWQ